MIIYEDVSSLFEDNKFTRCYLFIINKALSKDIDPLIYYEKHHIVLKSLKGSDNPENLVCLTLRNHFIVHYLLSKMCINKQHTYKMLNALHFMSCLNYQFNNAKVLADIYALKKERKHTEETKLKLSKSARLRLNNKWPLLSEKQIQKRVDSFKLNKCVNKRYLVTMPNGVQISVIDRVGFCKDFNLKIVGFSQAASHHHLYKGYKIEEIFGSSETRRKKELSRMPIIRRKKEAKFQVHYLVTMPNGNILTVFNRAGFCKDLKLNTSRFSQAAKYNITYKNYIITKL